MSSDSKPAKWLAEAFGTFWLVFGGCGSAIFPATFPFNPAVTLGAAVSGRFPWKDLPGSRLSQIIGGLLAGVLFPLLWERLPFARPDIVGGPEPTAAEQ